MQFNLSNRCVYFLCHGKPATQNDALSYPDHFQSISVVSHSRKQKFVTKGWMVLIFQGFTHPDSSKSDRQKESQGTSVAKVFIE